ncbi:MAG: type II secretion system protein [Candidatus Omnitrophica bacterium]|nr:type II secretion system protein [Candidatus Omnitrophota bacterium]
MTRKSGVTLMELIFVAAIFMLVVALLTPFVNMSKERSRVIDCEKNLRNISLALGVYASEHGEEFPKELKELYPNYITDQAVFDCPASKTVGEPDRPDYIYTAGLKALSPAKSIVVEDIDGNHGKCGKHLLRVDGSIDWIRSAR